MLEPSFTDPPFALVGVDSCQISNMSDGDSLTPEQHAWLVVDVGVGPALNEIGSNHPGVEVGGI